MSISNSGYKAFKFSLHCFFLNQILYKVSNLASELFSKNSKVSTYLDNSSIFSGITQGARGSELLSLASLGIMSKIHLREIPNLSQALRTFAKS